MDFRNVKPIKEQVFEAIKRERKFQDKKWGSLSEHPHTVGEWILIMQKELREASDAWCSKRGDVGVLEEILQVVSVGFACMEQHGFIERTELALDLKQNA